jgi:hypothetical protein
MSEARSPEDIRADFIAQCKVMVNYWDNDSRTPDTSAKLSGLLHSILVIIDGSSGGFPVGLDLVCRPHPDDKAYLQSEDEDWIEDGTVLNADVMLHELLYT